MSDVLPNSEDLTPGEDLAKWALGQPAVAEECRKLWDGLAQDEQFALSRLAHGLSAYYTIRELLALKGLIRSKGRDKVDSSRPCSTSTSLHQGSLGNQQLWLDEGVAVVWVEGRLVTDLTRLEFEVLRYLYRRLGQVCTREEIMAALYPAETLDPDKAGADNPVDTLVRRLRKAIEPAPGHPRYLLTLRGHGYKLVDTPDRAGATR